MPRHPQRLPHSLRPRARSPRPPPPHPHQPPRHPLPLHPLLRRLLRPRLHDALRLGLHCLRLVPGSRICRRVRDLDLHLRCLLKILLCLQEAGHRSERATVEGAGAAVCSVDGTHSFYDLAIYWGV